VGLALSVVYQERFSLHSRIVYPLLVYSAIFLITTLLTLATDFNGSPLFAVTLLAVTLSGICGAVLSGGLFSMSAVFPPSYTAALMTGQALAGVVVSLSDMLTTYAGEQPQDFCSSSLSGDDGASAPSACAYKTNYSALAYFLIATLVLLVSAMLQYVLMKLPFTVYLMRRQGWDWMSKDHGMRRLSHAAVAAASASSSGGIHDRLLDPSSPGSSNASFRGSDVGVSGAEILSRLHSSAPASSRRLDPGEGQSVNQAGEADDEAPFDVDAAGQSGAVSFHSSRLRRDPSFDRLDSEAQASLDVGGVGFPTILRVGRAVLQPALAAMFTFTVTLSVFPALTVFLQSQSRCKESSPRLLNDLYVPLFFLLYNAGDFTGRVLAGWVQALGPRSILPAALARAAFVPLFLLCNNANSQLPVVFASDAWPISFMVLMAVSNGYVASSAMMLGPSLVDSRDKNLAGTVMIFTLTLGLMIGSVLSFSVVSASQGGVSR
jgi:hypothetical protein